MPRTLTVAELIVELQQMPDYWPTDVDGVVQSTRTVHLVGPNETRHL